MSSVSKPRVRQNRHKQGLNQTLEKISADFRNIKRFYTKNCFRIIYIFLFWSFCYALYGAILDKSFGIVYFVKATILGPSHFWFLKMLLGLYIAVPILRAITYTKRLEEYFILIAILTAFVIPTFISLIGLFDETAKLDALKYYNEFEIRIASGYVGYFVLGHYLFTYKLNNFLKKLIYLMGLLSVLSVIALTHWYSHYIGESSSGIFYGYLTVFTLFESMAIFLIIKQFNVSENYSSLIIRLSNLSLGVYLIHVLIYRMADDIFGINTISFNPLFFIPCFSLIVFVISCLIVALLKRIPVLKKFVM